jgi:arylsulfatase A-like enzyme
LPSSQIATRIDGWFFEPPQGAVLSVSNPRRFHCQAAKAVDHEAYAFPRSGVRNVILLSVDTLRADALEMAHRGRPIMPRTSAFARHAIYAPRAITTYPATVFAMGSALTGLSASRVLFAPRPPPNILHLDPDPSRTHLAILPSSSWFRQPVVESLFLQGVEARRHEDARAQVDDLIRTLSRERARHAPHFVWAHFFEPHAPQRSHRGFSYGRSAAARYKSEVAYLDAQLGRVFAWLERSGAYDDTLVVLFADHGEALGERGYYGHHVFLNGFIADVPIIIRAPGAGHRLVRGVTSVTDVAATVAHYLGFALDPTGAGWSLLAGDPPAERIVVAEAFPIRGKDLFDVANEPVRTFDRLEARMARIQASVARYAPKVALATGHHRLIVNRQTGLGELYDRRADPAEEQNLLRREPGRVARMMALLDQWHRSTSEAIYCASRAALEAPSAPAPEARAPGSK